MNCPECDKMMAVKEKSQVIGEFLEWLTCERSTQVELCVRNDLTDRIMPCYTSTEQLLAEFFDIDLDKVEEEKRGILDEIKKANK